MLSFQLVQSANLLSEMLFCSKMPCNSVQISLFMYFRLVVVVFNQCRLDQTSFIRIMDYCRRLVSIWKGSQKFCVVWTVKDTVLGHNERSVVYLRHSGRRAQYVLVITDYCSSLMSFMPIAKYFYFDLGPGCTRVASTSI